MLIVFYLKWIITYFKDCGDGAGEANFEIDFVYFEGESNFVHLQIFTYHWSLHFYLDVDNSYFNSYLRLTIVD